MIHATLTGLGRMSWNDARGLLSGCTCAWADLDGFHVEPPPAEPPLTTHLWAWENNRLLRLRVDGAECVAGQLDLDAEADHEMVQVVVRRSTTWPLNEGRVSVADDLRGRTVMLYEVMGLMPLTFACLEVS